MRGVMNRREVMSRLVPPDLGGRLIATVVLVCLLTIVLTSAVFGLLIWSLSSEWRDRVARSDAEGLNAFVVDETDALLRSIRGFAATSSGPDARRRRANSFLTSSGARALVVLAPDGSVAASSGPASDVRVLGEAARGRTADVTGPLASPTGPLLVAGTPITAAHGGGYAIVATGFGPESQARYEGIAARVALTVRPLDDARAFAGSQALAPTANTKRLAYREDAEGLIVLAELTGIDGRPAAVVELRERDERTRLSNIASLIAGSISIVMGIGFGVLLGRLMARAVQRPVAQMVEHVKTDGYLAVEGAPLAAESQLDDPSLPVEFRELGAVVQDLLRHLASRQADLRVAIAQAEYAEESLGIVVSESREAKIVLQDGRVVVANPAASVATGVPQALLLDRTFSAALGDVVVADESGALIEPVPLLERALEGPVTARVERAGQQPRWYVFQATRHADDLHNRILVSARDVTEDRRLQQIRSEIVSIISHDLRSPLSVVIGYLDLLRRPLSDGERDKAIDSAKRNAARMADLLEDLLSATRAEELLAPSELVPVSLATVAEEVVTSLSATHTERPLTLDAPCAPVVRGEEKRLRQVLVNLVTNAFKYAPDDSAVDVRITCRNGRAALAVVDHGPGVPEQDRERIFDRYTRLDGASGRPGVGLGLYIVRIIAENHGGTVHVEETPGGGATFVVQLPCAGSVVDGEIVLGEGACGKDALADNGTAPSS